MSKLKMVKISLIIMIATFIVGIILIVLSSSIGESIGTTITSQGPGFATSTVDHEIINVNTLNYRIVGLVISVLGGCGILLSGYALYKEL